MKPLEYQKEIAKFDERIAYYEAKSNEYKHKRATFILATLDATLKAEEDKKED